MILKGQIKTIKLTPGQKTGVTNLRTNAVRAAWRREKELILQGKGHRQWNERQQREILERGSVRGFEGHHMISVKYSIKQAGNPDNIQFLTWREHLLAHNVNFRQPTNGYYDPETGKMHTFRKGIPHQPPLVTLAVISPVLMAAMNRQRAGTAENKSNGTGSSPGAKNAGNTSGSVKDTGEASGSQGGTGMINVDEQKYEDMISALYTFAQTINDKVEEMMGLTTNCCSIMDGDEAVGKAVSRIGEVEKAYLEAAKEGIEIAKDMSAELEEYRRIKSAADSDE